MPTPTDDDASNTASNQSQKPSSRREEWGSLIRSESPLKGVSTQQIEEAIAKALEEIAPASDRKYEVSIASIEFGEKDLVARASKLQMSVRSVSTESFPF